jgi:PPM family protein phosphatase
MSLETKRKTEIFSINYFCSAGTDVGRQRDNNEDFYVFDAKHDFFMVVDGMGGHEKGEVAAKLAAQTIQTAIRKIESSANIRLRDSIILANNAVFKAAVKESTNMGCVLTAALIENEIVTVGHIGDTRLYKIRKGKINKLTTDHSIVGMLEEEGNLSETRLLEHPQRNEVTRCVGIAERTFEDEDFVDILQTEFEKDAAFLLCSDGLSDLLTTAQIFEIIEQNADSPQVIIEKLISKANEASGKDNITVIFIGGKDFADEVYHRLNKPVLTKKQKFFSLFSTRLAFLIYGLMSGGAIMYFLFSNLLNADIDTVVPK